MVKVKNYEDVLKYLNLALKSCKDNNETESLKVLIKQIIFSFEKLIKKHKNKNDHGICARCKRHFEKKELIHWNARILCRLCKEKLSFPNPQLSLDLIDHWIKEQKNAINDN
jgi:hypothetical protein